MASAFEKADEDLLSELQAIAWYVSPKVSPEKRISGLDARDRQLKLIALYRAKAWDAALEEAAKIAESFNHGDEAVMCYPTGIARAIRRELKEQK